MALHWRCPAFAVPFPRCRPNVAARNPLGSEADRGLSSRRPAKPRPAASPLVRRNRSAVPPRFPLPPSAERGAVETVHHDCHRPGRGIESRVSHADREHSGPPLDLESIGQSGAPTEALLGSAAAKSHRYLPHPVSPEAARVGCGRSWRRMAPRRRGVSHRSTASAVAMILEVLYSVLRGFGSSALGGCSVWTTQVKDDRESLDS